jgi:hypothetical protein
LPISVVDVGVKDHAAGAVQAAHNATQQGRVIGVGIDAPLYWVAHGGRAVDQLIRQRITELGAPNATVQAVNSLRGACLVQGMLAGVLSRRQSPGIPIAESHAKALLWLLRHATPQNPPAGISLPDLQELFALEEGLHPTDHERDAALACLSAWAMIHQPQGWRDIAVAEQQERLSLIGPPLSYWVPG